MIQLYQINEEEKKVTIIETIHVENEVSALCDSD